MLGSFQKLVHIMTRRVAAVLGDIAAVYAERPQRLKRHYPPVLNTTGPDKGSIGLF